MGRPSEFTQEIADIICERIAAGEGLRDICKADGMPTPTAIYKWLNQLPDFVEQYARARDTQADTFADDVVGIADTEEDPQKARVRIDARKWAASKLKPKKYGDKLDIDQNVSGKIEFVTVYEPEPVLIEHVKSKKD